MNFPPVLIFHAVRWPLAHSAALLALAALALAGCASASRPQTAAGATPLGAPRTEVRPDLIERVDSAGGPPELHLPDRITLPATYRVLLLDGHWTLVKEDNPSALAAAPASLRIVAGEIARGELAYQPGLLPQELAAEVSASRESAARMDHALSSVMQRSRELAAQTERLEAQTRALAALLAADPHRRPAAASPSAPTAPANPADTGK
jgi:hypothetical protein